MKTLLILAMFLVPTQTSKLSFQKIQPQQEKMSPELKRVLAQVSKNNPKLDKTFQQELAQTILKKSKKHGVPVKILAAILMQESSYKMGAKGVKCGISLTTGEKDCVAIDFGIGQINERTIKSYGFDKKKLMTDLTYSVDATAKVLADFKKGFKKSEPDTWFCRYNAGTRPKEKIKTVCNTYMTLVARHM